VETVSLRAIIYGTLRSSVRQKVWGKDLFLMTSSRAWTDQSRLALRNESTLRSTSKNQRQKKILCSVCTVEHPRDQCWSVLGPFSRASRSNLKLTSLTSRFSPFTKNHGDSVAFSLVISIVHGSFLSRERLQHSPSSPFSLCSIAAVAYETCFLGQDWARHPNVHHRCHRCPFIRLPGFDRYLFSEPHNQRLLCICPGYRCLHDSLSRSSLTFYDVDERQQCPRQ
jgi:hypothetical protein